MNVKTRVHLIISGFVQGVFFRQETKRRADDLDVKGWVSNRDDGKVEAVFEGEEQNVKKLTDWCRHGPAGATVTKIQLEWETYVDEFDSFQIRLG